MSRGANDECRLCAMDPHTPPRRLLAIATSTDGILNESGIPAGQFDCGRPERKGLGSVSRRFEGVDGRAESTRTKANKRTSDKIRR